MILDILNFRDKMKILAISVILLLASCTATYQLPEGTNNTVNLKFGTNLHSGIITFFNINNMSCDIRDIEKLATIDKSWNPLIPSSGEEGVEIPADGEEFLVYVWSRRAQYIICSSIVKFKPIKGEKYKVSARTGEFGQSWCGLGIVRKYDVNHQPGEAEYKEIENYEQKFCGKNP